MESTLVEVNTEINLRKQRQEILKETDINIVAERRNQEEQRQLVRWTQ
jgi:hypothetical protein